METKGILSKPSRQQYNDSHRTSQAEHWKLMRQAVDEHIQDMSPEQRRKAETELALGKAENTMSQLVDRIETDSFQG